MYEQKSLKKTGRMQRALIQTNTFGRFYDIDRTVCLTLSVSVAPASHQPRTSLYLSMTKFYRYIKFYSLTLRHKNRANVATKTESVKQTEKG